MANNILRRLIFPLHLILAVSFLISTIAESDYLTNEIFGTSSGSCALVGKCCPGRDSSCVVQKSPPNSIVEDLSDVSCYCDHACLIIGDCCSDFKPTCGVQDCEVSSWGPWSECSQECGPGVMTRTRSVLVEARNGGQPCSSLVQKRGCRGTQCIPHHNRLNSDTAIILPVEFNRKRKINKTSDITGNLRLRYPKNPAKERSKPYCVEFEVVRVTRMCKTLVNFASLREGIHACVVCEGAAKRPHLDFKCAGTGSENHSTRFSSLREPACHGKWKHKQSNSMCTCNTTIPQYIFV